MKLFVNVKMAAANRRSSMRDLRMASAASAFSVAGRFGAGAGGGGGVSTLTTSGRRMAASAAPNSAVATYVAAPRRTLALANVSAREQLSAAVLSANLAASSANSAETSGRRRETKRDRKRRQWLQILAKREAAAASGIDCQQHQQQQSRWCYLPDLVLELIFQMLPHEVITKNNIPLFP